MILWYNIINQPTDAKTLKIIYALYDCSYVNLCMSAIAVKGNCNDCKFLYIYSISVIYESVMVLSFIFYFQTTNNLKIL